MFRYLEWRGEVREGQIVIYAFLEVKLGLVVNEKEVPLELNKKFLLT